MIFDDPKSFPNSVVKFTKFKHFELRYMYAYMREAEELLQREVLVLGKGGKLKEAKDLIESAYERPDLLLFRRIVELLAYQKMLIWMTHNVTGSLAERANRRRGFGSEEHRRMEKETVEWTEEIFDAVLRRILRRA